MSVVYIVLPLAMIFVIVALIVFIRAVRAGQFDDMDTPSLRVLHDDTPKEKRETVNGVKNDESVRDNPKA
jgi:cbb3-type cytochrome oxidase maturation protein